MEYGEQNVRDGPPMATSIQAGGKVFLLPAAGSVSEKLHSIVSKLLKMLFKNAEKRRSARLSYGHWVCCLVGTESDTTLKCIVNIQKLFHNNHQSHCCLKKDRGPW